MIDEEMPIRQSGAIPDIAMTEKRAPEISAVEAIHEALRPFDQPTRNRVLRSVSALLDMSAGETQAGAVQTKTGAIQTPAAAPPTRPVSIVELIQDKKPGTNLQRIALFAYYRERFENEPRFSRNDIKGYFAKAKENPPTNFDRDFVDAVKKGWIHEDGGQSYITSRGIEIIESGFTGERKYQIHKAAARLSRAKAVKRVKKG